MAHLLPTMNWSDPDLSEAMSLFKQKMNLYIDDEESTEHTKQARKICRGIGNQGLRHLNASGLTNEEKKLPEHLWNFFKSQLRVNVNFRVHRLHLMQYRQKQNETLDDFITRARTLAHKCDFTDEELSKRLIKLIIFSTPYEAVRNELYSKAKGYSIANVLNEGRKYEALTAGNEQLNQLGKPKTERIDNVNRGRTCGNYNTSHKRRQWPAYNDECSACGSKGHWDVEMLQKGKTQRPQKKRQAPQQFSQTSKPNPKENRRQDIWEKFLSYRYRHTQP